MVVGLRGVKTASGYELSWPGLLRRDQLGAKYVRACYDRTQARMSTYNMARNLICI